MSKMSDLLSGTVRIIKIDEHPKDIHPIKTPSFEITESIIEIDPQVCYAFIVSGTAFDKPVVLEFIENYSGLPGWFVVPGYPYLNKDKKIEWKVTRWKDW